MKRTIFAFVLFLLFSNACTEKDKLVQPVNQVGNNMKIIPEKPISNDEIKLVVFDDCTYNVLSGVTRDGKIIDIRKRFNSMMKWPCFMKNDTILIGKLPEGTYTVNYKLVDLSTVVKDSIALSFSFALLVSK